MKKLAVLLASTATLLSGLSPGPAAGAEPSSNSSADQSSTVSSDVIVTAPRHEDQAREAKKSAYNIVEIQSAETIAKYPDFNAAEALSRVPGISLSTDTGEGRFVNI